MHKEQLDRKLPEIFPAAPVYILLTFFIDIFSILLPQTINVSLTAKPRLVYVVIADHRGHFYH